MHKNKKRLGVNTLASLQDLDGAEVGVLREHHHHRPAHVRELLADQRTELRRDRPEEGDQGVVDRVSLGDRAGQHVVVAVTPGL